ncbi:MAG: acetyl-CoA carboxylase biotin carboxyl carrier protein [Oscillospiraceae bacterium]|nr:acetyl-CoA carboxylase biotin carboxyl carrier protein [Oscillospiraceae bacterium]
MSRLEEIKELAKTVSEYKLGKIKIKTDDEELVIEGKCCHKHHSMPPVMPPMAQAAPAPAASPAEAPAETPAAPAAKSGNVVKAPIVGTFYAAASPEDAPFVKVGDTVKKGDVLMIIESMKLMNEVTSDFDGVVEEIFAANGDAVEYDQPLMRIV